MSTGRSGGLVRDDSGFGGGTGRPRVPRRRATAGGTSVVTTTTPGSTAAGSSAAASAAAAAAGRPSQVARQF